MKTNIIKNNYILVKFNETEWNKTVLNKRFKLYCAKLSESIKTYVNWLKEINSKSSSFISENNDKQEILTLLIEWRA